MGNCISRRRQATRTRNPTEGLPVGKTRPLAPDPPLWRTDVRITRDQLVRKRDEFWDTAPVYEGRAEIWQALRAAAQAHEAGDVQLAQALITGANIFIPRGTLTECYDELGNRYLLPYYVLSYPTNLLSDDEVQQLQEHPSKHSRPHSHRSRHKKHSSRSKQRVCKACAQRDKQLSRPTSVQSQTGSSSVLSPPLEQNQYTGPPAESASLSEANATSPSPHMPLGLSPVNSIREIPESDSVQSGSDVRSSSASDLSTSEPCPHMQQQRQRPRACQHCGAGVEPRRTGLLRRFLHSSARSAAPPAQITCTCAKREPVAPPATQTLRIRISETNAELRLEVSARETVQSAKLQLQAQLASEDAPGGAIAEDRTLPELQRWLYCGRLLFDQQRIAHCKLQSDYVVLVSIRGLTPNIQ